jgi:hypothetical protein
MPTRNSRLNAAAEAVGSALGRFATELESWTHQGERQAAIEKVSAMLDSRRQQFAAAPPHAGKIGAIAEVAHLASPQSPKKSRAASRRGASGANAPRSTRPHRRSGSGGR